MVKTVSSNVGVEGRRGPRYTISMLHMEAGTPAAGEAGVIHVRSGSISARAASFERSLWHMSSLIFMDERLSKRPGGGYAAEGDVMTEVKVALFELDVLWQDETLAELEDWAVARKAHEAKRQCLTLKIILAVEYCLFAVYCYRINPS